MIVPARQVAELPLESLAARVVDTGLAIAVAAPVADAGDGFFERVVVGQDRAAFAHRHVVRRVEAQGRELTERPRLAAGVARARRVAVVLDQPQVVLLAEGGHGGEVERVAERMCDNHRACARG